MTMQQPQYFTRAESADYLTAQGYPITTKYLAKLAHEGDSPRYRIFGNRALYAPADLLEWAEKRMSAPVTSTAQREARA